VTYFEHDHQCSLITCLTGAQYLFVRSVSVVRTDFSGFVLCLCVIVTFISESSAICEDRLLGILIIFVCDCDI
jgi:hypothetical protein